MRVIHTGTDVISVDEHGIIHKRVIEGVHIDHNAVIEAEKACDELGKGTRHIVLVDASAVHTMTPEAVEELKKNLANKRIATAIFSNRTGIRILVDYLARTQNPDSPVKIFQDKSDAIKWLLTFKGN
jgi:hypothetical protein